eukprot:gnl/TRDRNA2_/TRDRNA2_169440_c1_seq5.p1 gnl/TRDRNA2_/TRDRNA2_169440_c1~~gnl/TRDRNA2_/TRDRNA2_169440_c1_seq5.p1  ORF type:complete len:171 (-),score=23.73 gnl/TRDRNA2_/TRDRNA2_169440_c1_seq5:138-650(-)
MQEMQDLTVGLKLKSEADTIKQELNTEADTIKRELKAWAAAELSEKRKLVDSDSALEQVASSSTAVDSYVSQPRIGEFHVEGSASLNVSKAAAIQRPALPPLALPVGTSITTSDDPPISLSLSSPLFVGRSLQPIPAGCQTWSATKSSGSDSSSQQHPQRQEEQRPTASI